MAQEKQAWWSDKDGVAHFRLPFTWSVWAVFQRSWWHTGDHKPARPCSVTSWDIFGPAVGLFYFGVGLEQFLYARKNHFNGDCSQLPGGHFRAQLDTILDRSLIAPRASRNPEQKESSKGCSLISSSQFFKASLPFVIWSPRQERELIHYFWRVLVGDCGASGPNLLVGQHPMYE